MKGKLCCWPSPKNKTALRSFAGGAATEEGDVHCDLSEQTPEVEQEVNDLPLFTDAFLVICSFPVFICLFIAFLVKKMITVAFN